MSKQPTKEEQAFTAGFRSVQSRATSRVIAALEREAESIAAAKRARISAAATERRLALAVSSGLSTALEGEHGLIVHETVSRLATERLEAQQRRQSQGYGFGSTTVSGSPYPGIRGSARANPADHATDLEYRLAVQASSPESIRQWSAVSRNQDPRVDARAAVEAHVSTAADVLAIESSNGARIVPTAHATPRKRRRVRTKRR